MIISLVLKDRYSIKTDNTGKFLLGNKKVSVKEVPFIRYRFDDFKESDIEYIKNMMAKFKYSTHLAEVVVKDGFDKQLLMLNYNFENLAVFLYLPVYDSHVESCVLSEHDIELLEKLDGLMVYDRIILKDCSNSLHLVSANKLKHEISEVTGFNELEMGICNSPLSFGNDACLTALRARALASVYAQNDDCALPSANHECMNCCGCIKYYTVESDLAAPVSKKSVSKKTTKASTKEDNGNNTEKKEQKSKKKRSRKVIKAW